MVPQWGGKWVVVCRRNLMARLGFEMSQQDTVVSYWDNVMSYWDNAVSYWDNVVSYQHQAAANQN